MKQDKIIDSVIAVAGFAVATILSNMAGEAITKKCDTTFDGWEAELRKKNRRKFLFFGSKKHNNVGIR